MAEVLFMWGRKEVNLKLARSMMRHLAENHHRLEDLGPTQTLRDILDWLQRCGGNSDRNFVEMKEKFGASSDFDTVVEFLTSLTFDQMKAEFPKEHNSLWMAVRGVLRKRKDGAAAVAAATMPQAGRRRQEPVEAAERRDLVNHGDMDLSPHESVRVIKEGSDEVSFELLMLLMKPEHHRRLDKVALVEAYQAMTTALGDLEFLLGQLGVRAEDMVGSTAGSGDNDPGGGSTPSTPTTPGSPHESFPSSPGGSSSSGSGDSSKFAGGGGGGGWGGARNWYVSLLKMREAEIAQGMGAVSLGSGSGGKKTGTSSSGTGAVLQDTLKPSQFGR